MPVTTSEFAAPVVPAEKDGGIRLCSVYKTTVTPCLDMDRYPIPKIKDLLATLARGQHVSKIDLNRAYQ